MKIQFLKVFTGPPYELQGVRLNEKVDVPHGVDPLTVIAELYGSNWHAEAVQILGAL